jgi:hypothetical protein
MTPRGWITYEKRSSACIQGEDNHRELSGRCKDRQNMATKIGAKAFRQNPALEPFGVLVGEWETIGSHPYLPGTVLHGRVSIDWLEGGAFLILRSEIDEPNVPDGIEIFGSDDTEKKFYMLHFDERGVSRKYDVNLEGNQLKWWRDDPTFSQHFVLDIEDGGNRMVSKGQMSRDGAAWEDDLALTYRRIK